MDGSSSIFCLGVLYGAFAAGIVAVILNKIRDAKTKRGFRIRTLNNFPDAAQPGMTSSGIVKTSQQALLNLIMWNTTLIIFIGIVIVGLYYLLVT
ncbi:MAG: hypothetical protein HS126_25260 [Anaerolineales bacterium]|nr:hypothetical protein [Anaerolineales bacterium]